MSGTREKTAALLLISTALVSAAAIGKDNDPQRLTAGTEEALRNGFETPPPSARPRVWWHWMNGNVTIDGIDKDLDWLARIGVGGVQNFDANLTTQQIVDQRLVYMQPDWQAAFRHAVTKADAEGLEFAIASSPGWSETGGPWVPPADGMKKISWSETLIPGGEPFKGKIAPSPTVTGPYQTIPYRDVFVDPAHPSRPAPQAGGEIALLAVPVTAAPLPEPSGAASPAGQVIDPSLALDADPETAIDIPSASENQPTWLAYDYAKPVTISSARVFVKGAGVPFGPARYLAKLQVRSGEGWRDLADVPLGDTPTTVSFAPVTASRIRLEIRPSPPQSGGGLGSVPGAVVFNLFADNKASAIAVGQFQLFAGQRVQQAEAKAGFETVPNYYVIASRDTANGPRPDQVIDLTDKLAADGTLSWTPPKGTAWRLINFGWSLTGTTNHPATAEATGLEVDKYDAAAVERYMTAYLDMYRKAVGAENIGAKGIRALLTDSTEVGESNWTPRLLEEFKTRRGYDPLPWLPTLTGTTIGSSAQSDKFLYDFRRTLGDLMADAHYGTVARVAHANGLTLYGEALEDGRPVLGDDLDMRHYADVPMSALWTFPAGGKPRFGLLGDMKGAASVAHFYGQNLVAAESMTSAFSPWAFAPRDLKHVIDLEFVQGVNRPVIHTSVHQPTDDKLPGLSLAIFGQYFNRHETWASMAKPWISYIARTAYMLQQGSDAADLAVFYGEETPVTVLYGEGQPAWLPKGHAFDFVNWKMLTLLKVDRDGEMMSPGGARYKALYLGGTSKFMTVPTLRELKRLADAGARIIGTAPEASPSLDDSASEFKTLVASIWAKPKVLAQTDVDSAMHSQGIADDFGLVDGDTGADLRFVHRKLPDGDIYFIDNRETHGVTVKARFRVNGKAPELWHAVDGSVRQVSYESDGQFTTVPLDLGSEDAVFIVFRKPAKSASLQVAPAVFADAATLSKPWQVTFEKDRGAPASITMNKLVPLNENSDPAIRYFSGTATYATTVEQPRGWHESQKLWLDLGKIGDVAEVLINGKPVGITWFTPYRVEIGSLMKPGTNRIEIKVADLWVNRLIGDQQPGAKPLTWTAVPTYKPDAPLRPSGLIGPVRLISER